MREEVLVTIYHEIAHICCETMQEVNEQDIRMMIENAIRNHGSKYGKQIEDRIKSAPYDVRRSYLAISAIVSPFLPTIVNALEDARVNAEQFKARKGTRIMFEADVRETFALGVEQVTENGVERIEWRNYPLNAQVMVGLFVKASGYKYDTYFADEVVTALNDAELGVLVNKIHTARNVGAVYGLSFPILARLRELGYCKSELDPEPEPEPDEGGDEGGDGEPDPNEDATSDETGQEEGDASSDSPPENASGSDESDSSDQSDPGDGSEEDQPADSAGEPEEEDAAEGSDSGADSEEGAGDRSDHEEPSGDGEAAQDPGGDLDGDQSELGGSEEDSQAGEADAGEAADDDGADGAGRDTSGTGAPDEAVDPSEGAVGEEGAGGGEDPSGEREGDPDHSDTESDGAGDGSRDLDVQPEAADGSSADETSEEGGVGEEATGDLDDQDGSGDSGQPSGEQSDEAGDGEGGADAPGLGEQDDSEAGESSDPSITPSQPSSKPGGNGTGPDPDLDSTTGDGMGAPEGEPADEGVGDGGNLPSDAGDDNSEPANGSGDGADDGAEAEAGNVPAADVAHPPTAEGTPESEADEGVPDGHGDDLPSVQDSADANDDPYDSGADDGTGGIEVVEKESNDRLPMGDAEDANVKLMEWMGHGEKPKSIEEQELDDQIVDRAIVQGIYFETPSREIYGVREHKYGEPTIVDGYIVSGAWDRHHWGRSRTKDGTEGEFKPSESIVGPALLRMRVAFSDNQRGKEQRHLKAGKVNARVLGRRAPFGDERLFQRRTLPGKKDYFVLIGMDVSGSTVGRNIVLEKQAVTAQAELLHRLGIKFAIYAHSGNLHAPKSGRGGGFDLEIYLIKEPHEPWSGAIQERLFAIGPDSCNLDGHALEYLRKVCDRVHATDKIILYYSDGKMPAENHDEELEILQREIKICEKRGITLLGVGIRTDSPARHGLDTVEVNGEEDVVKVVKHIEKRLLAR